MNREYTLSPIITTETTTRQSRSRNRSPVYEKNIETKVSRDISYESEPIVDNVVSSSSTSTMNRSYNNYNTNSRSVEQQIVPYNETVEVNSKNLASELNELPLAGNIMPGPGTKVTTTVSIERILTILRSQFSNKKISFRLKPSPMRFPVILKYQRTSISSIKTTRITPTIRRHSLNVMCHRQRAIKRPFTKPKTTIR